MNQMPNRSQLRKNLKALRIRLEKRPLDLDARMRMARTHRLLKQHKKAISHYHAVARYLSLSGHPLQAIAVLKELLQLDPNHQETLMFLAKLYARTRAADTSNRGRVAVPILEMEDSGAIALPEGLPMSVTGIWRAIRPQSTDVYTVVHDAMKMPEVSIQDDLLEIENTLDLSNDDIIEEEEFLDEDPSPAPQNTTSAKSSEGGHKQSAEPSDPFLKLPDADGFEFLGEIQTEDIVLPKVPLFSSLSEDAFMQLGHAMVFHRASKGQTIFKENDLGDSCLVISRGEAKARKMNKEGQDVELMTLGEGDFAGVFALLAAEKRQATLVAASDLEYFEIDRLAVQKIIERFPDAQEALDSFVKERLLLNLLATLPLSATLSAERRQKLAQMFEIKDVPANANCTYPDTQTNSLTVILSGEIEIANQHEEQMALLGIGDYYGTIAQPGQAKSEFTMTSRVPCVCLELPSEHLEELFSSDDKAKEQMASRFSELGQLFGTHLFVGNGRLPANLTRS